MLLPALMRAQHLIRRLPRSHRYVLTTNACFDGPGPDAAYSLATLQGPIMPVNSAEPGGNFVVVWFTDGAISDGGVFGQRFDAAGARLGAEFQVATDTTQLG